MAVVVVRDQHRVGDRGRHRDRPAVLDAAAAARRAAGESEAATLRYWLLHAAACLVSHSRMLTSGSPEAGPGRKISKTRSTASARSPDHQALPDRPRKEQPPPGPWNPASPHDTRRRRLSTTPESRPKRPLRARHGPPDVKFKRSEHSPTWRRSGSPPARRAKPVLTSIHWPVCCMSALLVRRHFAETSSSKSRRT